MRARLHRFLLTLLMLILPAQALASATMLEQALSQQAVVAQMDDARSHCHQPDPADPVPASHECAHCAACVLASALPMSHVVTTAPAPTPHRFLPSPAVAFNGFIPDGPERPPRHSLV